MKFLNFPIIKCKNFGYTFSIIFGLLALLDIYFFTKHYPLYITLSILLLIISAKKPELLKPLGFYWEKFGILLGTIFSPIILTFVYIITIIPINLLIRILRIDLIKIKISKAPKSYWKPRSDNKINFKDQF